MDAGAGAGVGAGNNFFSERRADASFVSELPLAYRISLRRPPYPHR